MRLRPASVVVALFCLLPAGAAAQEEEPPPVSEEERELILRTLRVRDSLRAVPDSLLADSAAPAAREADRERRTPAGGARGGRQERAGGTSAGPALDSIARVLARLQGYRTTTYASDSARFEMADRRLHLFADSANRARVGRDGNVLTADSLIVYQEGRSMVEVYGNPTFTPPDGDPVESTRMFYDLDRSRGTALGARTQVSTDATWYIDGDLPSVASDTVFASHADFTTCELDEPHYHFRSSEVKIVDDDVLVARPVTLYFADVPVMWLPFMAQSMKQGRRSGILTPRFSVNDIVRTSTGYERRVSNIGFYWAMNRYMDSQLAMDWFSDRFFALTGNFRYHILRKFLRGEANYRQFWRSEGGKEMAFDTRHSWEISERTNLRISARYTSSAEFVRRNSFDPREVTQSIDSDAGFSHRFDWGNFSLSGNRKQFLTDDRVEMVLPSMNLSLSPMTLFEAPRSRAGPFNNITWSGGTNMTVSHSDRPEADDTVTASVRPDSRGVRAGLSSSFTVGQFAWSQSASLDQRLRFGVRDTAGVARDVGEATVDWSTNVDYQQRLIGATTLTPTLRVSGSLFRTDTLDAASSFVSAPLRVSAGVRLKSDIYGFFGGVGPFSAVRHKISPSISWDYSPSVTPTDLQRDVFRTRGSQVRNELRVGLNQTFEAKQKEDTATADSAAADTTGAGAPGGAAAADTAGTRRPGAAPGRGTGQGREPGEPRRIERAEAVTLLSIQTSAVTYDLVRADSLGGFVEGFTNPRLQNQIRSDFLQGLSFSMEHELFQEGDEPGSRSFEPRLSQLNLSFSMSSSSGIFQALGFGAPSGEEAEEEAAEAEAAEEESAGGSGVVPVRRLGRGLRSRRGGGGGPAGGWRANVSYSLQRRGDDRPPDQMLQWSLNFQPTEHWDVNWRSSYDMAAGRFNDHIMTLTRDLHRWEASFDFLQTPTGNWSFRFRVALTDNRDLKFDYDQRSTTEEGELRRGARRRR